MPTIKLGIIIYPKNQYLDIVDQCPDFIVSHIKSLNKAKDKNKIILLEE